MGEMADAFLDGTFCQCCGELMVEHDAPGYPVTCEGCMEEEALLEQKKSKQARRSGHGRYSLL
jgi:hypothetical protein